jgi:hypothetical protein
MRLVHDRPRRRDPEESREQADRDNGGEAPLAAGRSEAEQRAHAARAALAEREGGEDGNGAEREQEAGRREERQVHQ